MVIAPGGENHYRQQLLHVGQTWGEGSTLATAVDHEAMLGHVDGGKLFRCESSGI